MQILVCKQRRSEVIGVGPPAYLCIEKMRILLIRHGQDERGYRGGWSQRGLTAEGFAQARALATHLRVRWRPIHLILSSDLRRAAETTAETLKAVQTLVQYAPEWREMNNGALGQYAQCASRGALSRPLRQLTGGG
jgi:broad specificity phosphatase PhoE